MNQIPFHKMHGMGNDYVYFDLITNSSINKDLLIEKIPFITDRNSGVGGDGIVLISKSEVADIKMSIFNIDCSEAEMCGNALMCVILFSQKYLFKDKKNISVETKTGVSNGSLVSENRVKVKMFRAPSVSGVSEKIITKSGEKFDFYRAEIGNPHAVINYKDLDRLDLKTIGPEIENNLTLFPKRTNVEFFNETKPSVIQMRVWERGSGETMSCGSGAASTAAVYRMLNSDKYNNIVVNLKKGSFIFHWEGNDFYMTGNAEYVFNGELVITE